MPKFLNRALPILVAAFAVASPAEASDARISVSAFVPIRCELSFTPAIDLSGTVTVSLGTVQQYCNARYQMRFFHAPLSPSAVIGLGAASAAPSGGSTFIEPNGRPVISASNLWLTSNERADAQTFVNSVVIEVTPLGF